MKVLFSCDIWKSYDSRVLLGVFDDDVLLEECIRENNLRGSEGNEYFDIVEVNMNEEV